VDCVRALAPGLLGRPLRTPRGELLRSLDPVYFVRIRDIPGGPGSEAVPAAFESAEAAAAEDEGWIREISARLKEYRERLRALAQEMRTTSSSSA
jgi:hypothetical protein